METRSHKAWKGMHGRCRSTGRAFSYYSGRGISVCDRWKSFENFLDDMGEPPEGMTLDRIDNNKGYSPENCRWADMRTQSRNRRSTILVDVNGEQVCLLVACEKLGLHYDTVKARIRAYGWPISKALSPTPPQRNRGRKMPRKNGLKK